MIHFHFPLSCTQEGNGNPLQYSCLENPRDGGAWWAAVYGIAQSQTRLKRLSSSSSMFSEVSRLVFLAAKSCLTLATPETARLLNPWDFPGKNIGVGCHFAHQGFQILLHNDKSYHILGHQLQTLRGDLEYRRDSSVSCFQ